MPEKNSVIKSAFVFIVIITFYSCFTRQDQRIDYLPIGKFSNDTSLIQPGTRVRLLAFSGSEDNSKETIYYSQVIVVNKNNGDTISILCPALQVPSVDGSASRTIVMPNEFDPEKGIVEAVYQRSDSTTVVALQIISDVAGQESSPEVESLTKYTDGIIVKKQLVAINRSIPIFFRKYKTVIGILSFDTNIQK